jgi:hypothetical protein
MDMKTYQRSIQAEQLVRRLTDNLTSDQAKAVYGLHDNASANAFALGYLSSMMIKMAAMSPKALKELANQVEWNEERLGE